MTDPLAGTSADSDALRSIGHALAIWSVESRLVSCNPAYAALFELGPDLRQIGFENSAFFEDAKERGVLIGFSQSSDDICAPCPPNGPCTRLLFSDGTVCLLEQWPLPQAGVVTMLRDVTNAERTQKALAKARDAAAEADQSKSRFLRAANHDLRQPLAALKILIYSCYDAEDAREREEALHAMDVSVSIMEDLLGALLNIGQLDAGKIRPNVQTFQISTVLERLRVQFAHQAHEAGLDLHILPSNVAVISDRVLLERIVSNFVSNALRYTPKGRVVVGCKRYGSRLRVMVIDTGVGIEEEYQEAIFQEFFRIDDSQISSRHSLGLGLNISRRLAQILNHPIHVTSTLGKGTNFSIDLPIGNVLHSSIGEPEINESIGGQFAGLICLLLEDDANLREALTTLLVRWGIVVMQMDVFDDVASSVAALEHAPDIILTDYRLQGKIQGTDVTRDINALLHTSCPTIVMTADTSPELIQSIRDQGFPVMIKPISPPGLRVLMHNLLFEN
ncbi:ATP-binding response regulator [Roseovarius sp. 217]|jgi:signal transduction histidine kinase/CheY-like chemotaxis protein|uniref:ATP-binding response regulator n=1 Tax=Roseovarius sp. (strain 217) TaxID=314264 RepID=UPI0000684F6E|nr:hybrid sensor histidine kinase/response regulator [Roseovarius sp. 217]EAQ23790.1 sensor histidine kinase [Roseovarius sp. 217]